MTESGQLTGGWTAPPAATLVSRHDAFAKKPIEQLGVVKELNALLCLSGKSRCWPSSSTRAHRRTRTGGDLTLHALPTFELLSSFATQTRAQASLFVLSTLIRYPAPPPRRTNSSSRHPGPPPLAAPEIHSTLAIACRRKLILFSWVDGGWHPPREVALPHQIRGMAFGESAHARKLLAGFSTGEYGIVSLPPLVGTGTGRNAPGDSQTVPTLGDLFSPPIPPAVAAAAAIAAAGPVAATGSSLSSYGERFGGLAKATGTSLGGLGGLAKATGLGALANLSLGGSKLEKNGVAPVPRAVSRGKRVANSKDKTVDPAAWLWGKEWGWTEERKEDEDEVLLVRESASVVAWHRRERETDFASVDIALPLSVSGQPRATSTSANSPSASPASQAVVYPVAADETLVLPPYIFTLLPAPPQSPTPSPSASPSLSIHSIESLAPIQTLAVPPRRPSSLAPTDSSDSSTATTASTESQVPSARLLTVASTSAQPPLVLLTTTPPTSTAPGEQTLWIVTMRSWESQIEELGQRGAWEEGIRLVRRSGTGGAELPVRPCLDTLKSQDLTSTLESAPTTSSSRHAPRTLALQRAPVRPRDRRLHRARRLAGQGRRTVRRADLGEALCRASGQRGDLWRPHARQGAARDRRARAQGRRGKGRRRRGADARWQPWAQAESRRRRNGFDQERQSREAQGEQELAEGPAR